MFKRKVVWKKVLKDSILRIVDDVVWLVDKSDYTRRVRVIGLKNISAVYVFAKCNNIKVLICAVRAGGTIFNSYCSTLVMYSNGELEVEVN
jgi:hypothetical protein